MSELLTIGKLFPFVICISTFVCAILYEKHKKNKRDFANELKKEKENYRILSEKYYCFCKEKFTETQKAIVSLHIKHTLRVDDYDKYLEEVRQEKLNFYECTKQERDRYLHGEIDDVLKFKYQSEEVISYEKTIEKICSEFHDLIFYA